MRHGKLEFSIKLTIWISCEFKLCDFFSFNSVATELLRISLALRPLAHEAKAYLIAFFSIGTLRFEATDGLRAIGRLPTLV